MLRFFVLGLGVILLATGVLGLTFGGGSPMLAPLIFGALLLIGTVFEPHYKHNEPAPPSDGFAPTGERFHDPNKNQTVEVWYNPATGERRYIAPEVSK
jgi:hypothetical protein